MHALAGASRRVMLAPCGRCRQSTGRRRPIHRLSGDISNWKRVNRRFLNTLRKQFLIWRTLRAEERERYLVPAWEALASAE